MEITLIVVLPVVLLLTFLWLRMERKTTVTIDGYTIKLRRGREFAWIVYREPSGRTLTLEVDECLGPGNQPQVLVEFPSEIAFCQDESDTLRGGTVILAIPDTPSSPISKQETTQVQARIVEGLSRLKIQHQFISPRRSGWTSFEEGKEIYHG